jgi:hypothetical protein
MRVDLNTTVEFSTDNYTGGPLSDYFTDMIRLPAVRSMSTIDAAVDYNNETLWGSYTKQPVQTPSDPSEVSFVLNMNGQDWIEGSPLALLWMTKPRRVCRITITSNKTEVRYVVAFVCQPFRWSVLTALNDVTVISCSVLAVTPIQSVFTTRILELLAVVPPDLDSLTHGQVLSTALSANIEELDNYTSSEGTIISVSLGLTSNGSPVNKTSTAIYEATVTGQVNIADDDGNTAVFSLPSRVVQGIQVSNTVAPTISGSTAVGSILTSAAGTWLGFPTPTLTRQWRRNGVAISGATGLTYTLGIADSGADITCAVTGVNPLNSVTVVSNTITAQVVTVPAAFGVDDWTPLGFLPDSASIELFNLPDNGGLPLTSIQYRRNSSSVVALDGTTVGNYPITAEDGDTFEVRAVNELGAGAWSSVKTIVFVELPPSLFTNNEPGAWYDPSDLSTLFQDRAGSTPVTAPGQSVGMRLDKSQGLEYGPELVVNGTFDSDTTGWAPSAAALSVVSGQLAVSPNDALTRFASQSIATVTGKTYEISFNYNQSTAANVVYYVGTTQGSGNIISTTVLSGTGSIKRFFVANSSSSVLHFGASSSGGLQVLFDNISVRELPGHHLTAINDASRGVYGIEPAGGRRNLLSPSVYGAGWSRSFFAVVPDFDAEDFYGNTNGAFTGKNNTGGADNWEYVTPTITIQTSAVYTFSAIVKPITVVRANIRPSNFTTPANFRTTIFNLTGAGSIVSGVPEIDASIENLGDGWYRLSVSFTTDVSDTTGNMVIGGIAAEGTGFREMVISGTQFEIGSVATNYQRVLSAHDVTEVGVDTLHYISYDGVDDSYVSTTITPATDTMQLFAGVRKLGNGTSIIAETGTSSTSTGAFYVVLEPTNTRYAFAPRGAREGSVNDQANINDFAAPDNAVLTARVSLNAGTPAQMRRNRGAYQNSVNTTFGGGNFLPHPLYVGRRAGSTLPFNGRDYGIIVRWGPELATNKIEAIEDWLAEKIGIEL